MEHPFLRNEMLWGPEAQARLARAHVLLLGLGGVGSYAAECLARSGVGELTLVDSDTIALTNLNRQLEALHSTLGQPKAEAVAARLRDINPDAELHPVHGLYDAAHRDCFFPEGCRYDYIVDAIDLVSCKLDLAETALKLNIPLIAALGTGNKLDPTLLQLTDISKRMVDLDFNAKYESNRSNSYEVEELGNHINRLSENLERTISELKTANVELQDDIEKKIQIDEMRKEFLSNVSHELKTPLALIQGYAEGLQECINDDAESREFYCDVIIDEADKMNRMVKKLLTLNQLEFGNDQVVMERFDMTELVRGVANSTKILMEQKGIRLELDNLEEAWVWGDEFKVEEVITNYMSNAINHADGGKVIRVFYTRFEDKLRVSVFNTGQPIPEDDIDKIWVKFYKVDKARTREYGGSGIGLSIVKAIMDSFHQQCGVINHEDGVEFWMELSTK